MNKQKFLRFLHGLLLTLLFLALLTGAVSAVSRLLERKNSRNKFEPFLDAPEQHDVLFIGDSLMVNGVFPMELYKDYGIPAYNLSSYGNTLPVTYWVMMNALDFCTPEVMVIGVKDVEKSYKLSGSSSDVHTALDCYPLTLTKARAIEDLMADSYETDDDGTPYADLKWEYYFKLGKYHSRWSELNEGDFRPQPTLKKGADYALGVAPAADYNLIDEYEMLESADGWGFTYLRKIIEECQNRGIDVLLVHLPHIAPHEEQRAANTVIPLADEYGVDYIDFVSMDQVADYATDRFDEHAHLNPSGARKVTDYLGRFLRDHYALKDRRTDPAYAAWDDALRLYTDEKAAYISGQNDLKNLLMLLHDASFSVCVAVGKDAFLYDDPQNELLLQNIPREHIFEEDIFSKWSNSLFPLSQLDFSARAPYMMIGDRQENTVQEFTQYGQTDASFGPVSWTQDGFTVGEQVVPVEPHGVSIAVFDEDGLLRCVKVLEK